MTTKKTTVTVTDNVQEIKDNARAQENTRIQDKMDEVLDKYGLPRVDLGDEDPFDIDPFKIDDDPFMITVRNKR